MIRLDGESEKNSFCFYNEKKILFYFFALSRYKIPVLCFTFVLVSTKFSAIFFVNYKS